MANTGGRSMLPLGLLSLLVGAGTWRMARRARH
jgi:hypothetical protein